MADEIALALIEVGSSSDHAFMILRSTEEHSGNWYELKECLRKGLVNGHSFPEGYYGAQGRDIKAIAGLPIIQWSEE